MTPTLYLQSSWDRSRTESLLAKRKAEILASAEARIRTSAEREQFAKQKLRTEAVDFATKKDLNGLKAMLMLSAEEADKTNTRPRWVEDVSCFLLSAGVGAT